MLILANREEAYARPTAGPRIEAAASGGISWLGGVDLIAGGTWLGVNSRGMVVAVTNRPKRDVPENPRSRGLLCRALLRFENPATARDEALRQLSQSPFAGCNLVLVNSEQALVIEAGDAVRTHQLSPGMHFITNHDLDDPSDARIARVRGSLLAAPERGIEDWLGHSRAICAARATDDAPAVCLEGTDRGTVSSTILTLPDVRSQSQYWYAAGAPSTTHYSDYSPLLRQLLSTTA